MDGGKVRESVLALAQCFKKYTFWNETRSYRFTVASFRNAQKQAPHPRTAQRHLGAPLPTPPACRVQKRPD